MNQLLFSRCWRSKEACLNAGRGVRGVARAISRSPLDPEFLGTAVKLPRTISSLLLSRTPGERERADAPPRGRLKNPSERRQQCGVVKSQPRGLDSCPDSALPLLCGLRQVTSPLQTSIFSSAKWGDEFPHCRISGISKKLQAQYPPKHMENRSLGPGSVHTLPLGAQARWATVLTKALPETAWRPRSTKTLESSPISSHI